MVVHGIGQKFSEKDDSWRFTHAMNDLRRSVNLARATTEVRNLMRNNIGGIMILPVNWRLRFRPAGEGAASSDGGPREPNSGYVLSDVTPNTIPGIRAILNDVMLDIPYYMSDHKESMIQAMVTEANTIYRLWCRNNPSFRREGRVHLVAHSLGSVMALDALSMQPTHVPTVPDADAEVQAQPAGRQHFDFNTTNVFFCGSPVGFFLYLNRAKLKPRLHRSKAGAPAPKEALGGLTGEFGCMAVDNVYNIIHPSDPIAYRVNACVDAYYAHHLRDAIVPPTSVSWMQYLLQRKTPVLVSSAIPTYDNWAQPDPIAPARIQRLPSSVEMEVHQFEQE